MKQHVWTIAEDYMLASYVKKGCTDTAAKKWLSMLLGIPYGKISARMADFQMLLSGKYPDRHYAEQELYVAIIA